MKMNLNKILRKKLKLRYHGATSLYDLSLLTICFVLSVFQIAERICFYLSEDTKMLYGLETSNRVRFPSITVCHTNGFTASYVQNEMLRRNVTTFYHLINEELDLNDLWILTGNNWTATIKDCYYSMTMNCKDGWQMQKTLRGMCLTRHFPEPYVYSGRGDLLLVQFNYDASEQYKVFIHDMSADLSYKGFQRDFIMEHGTSTLIYFEHRQTTYKNISRRPCWNHDVSTKCILKCHDDTILAGKTCRLPFVSADRSSLPLCSTPTDFQTTYGDLYKNTSGLFTYVKNCVETCGKPCERHDYDVSIGVMQSLRRGTDLYVIPLRSGKKIFTEQTTYSFFLLLCDIGAIAGMYFGLSLLAVVQILYVHLFDTRNRY